jgi:hypothetical protein
MANEDVRKIKGVNSLYDDIECPYCGIIMAYATYKANDCKCIYCGR